MSSDLLQTKLHAPRLRPLLVPRPRLVEILNQGLAGKLTLISAAAGFGKTTLVSNWIDVLQTGSAVPPPQRHPLPTKIAWLSLDENDGTPARFLSYVIAALQRLDPSIGVSAQPMLQASPLPIPAVLTSLLNDVAAQPALLMLVLDDYHVIDAQPIDEALAFLLDHLPPQLHLVITTREDPNLPLARLRARGLLTELRATDLRFTAAETAVFLQQVMGLELTQEQIAALEARTEGWIAGLQMAALSMRGQKDVSGFIRSFTGSHRFVLDYLLAEVLHQQPAHVQTFLLRTAILQQLTGSLCDALTGEDNGQQILESLERANLFLVPLDNERRWYRYHHLFAELLRQTASASDEAHGRDLHIRASEWYEANGLELEAFHHAVAANDVARAARLIEGEGLPLYFRGEAAPVQKWLASLPQAEFEARPSLWVTYASVLTMTGRLRNDIEEILRAAETALQDNMDDGRTTDLLGQIAAIRAMLAVPKNQVETIITQSQRALDFLHPNNAPMRTTTTWTLGYAYQLQGKRGAASQAYAETIAQSQKSGNLMTEIAATTCVGQIQETENQAHQAAQSFRRILQLVGDPPWPAACEACAGLARIHYQWNDLEAAERYGQQGLALARQLDNVDTPAACGVLLARVKLAQGDTAAAFTLLTETEQFVEQQHFDHWAAEITAVRIQALLHQGALAAAAQLAASHDLPFSQARIHLAQNDPEALFTILAPVQQQAETNDWADLRLQVLLLQALAYQALDENREALTTVREALTLASPGALLRPFLDEGAPMAALLGDAVKAGMAPLFAQQVLSAFGETVVAAAPTAQPLLDPLSERELEVLTLLRTELTGPEIASRLMVSLNTLRTHTKNIYSKLGVTSRRMAVRRAEELDLL